MSQVPEILPGTLIRIVRNIQVSHLDVVPQGAIGIVVGSWRSPDHLGGDTFYTLLVGEKQIETWVGDFCLVEAPDAK